MLTNKKHYSVNEWFMIHITEIAKHYLKLYIGHILSALLTIVIMSV